MVVALLEKCCISHICATSLSGYMIAQTQILRNIHDLFLLLERSKPTARKKRQ
jgi:hypothetical protein